MNSWRSVSIRGSLLLLAAALFLEGGCASSMSTKISPPFYAGKGDTALADHTADIVRTVEERNNSVEKGPEWRERAYTSFLIKELSDIDEKDYARYSQYLDNGAIYIIVHPAYYTFFGGEAFPSSYAPGVSQPNAMEWFLGDASFSAKSRLIKAQEKLLRDFLEYMSTERKLVLLILPKNYERYSAYRFTNARDEYMRYINEITNESDSVVYLYSRRPNRGALLEDDRRRLLKFLFAVKVKQILVGGGYVGRCLEDLYKEVEQYYSADKIYVVPEITAISPVDVTYSLASDLLLDNGQLDIARLTSGIRANVFGNQAITPNIRNLSVPEKGPGR